MTTDGAFNVPVEVFDPASVSEIPDYSASEVYHDPATGFRLHVGGVSDAMYANHLQTYGIRAILNCAAAQTASARRIIQASGNSLEGIGWDKVDFSQEWYSRELDIPSFMYLAIPAEDHAKFPLSDYFAETSAFIEEARCKGYNVLVHCMQGLNRSVAVTVAWMVTFGNHSLDSAIQHIAKLRPYILRNRGFLKQLVTLYDPPLKVLELPATQSTFVVKDIIERIYLVIALYSQPLLENFEKMGWTPAVWYKPDCYITGGYWSNRNDGYGVRKRWNDNWNKWSYHGKQPSRMTDDDPMCYYARSALVYQNFKQIQDSSPNIRLSNPTRNGYRWYYPFIGKYPTSTPALDAGYNFDQIMRQIQRNVQQVWAQVDQSANPANNMGSLTTSSKAIIDTNFNFFAGGQLPTPSPGQVLAQSQVGNAVLNNPGAFTESLLNNGLAGKADTLVNQLISTATGNAVPWSNFVQDDVTSLVRNMGNMKTSYETLTTAQWETMYRQAKDNMDTVFRRLDSLGGYLTDMVRDSATIVVNKMSAQNQAERLLNSTFAGQLSGLVSNIYQLSSALETLSHAAPVDMLPMVSSTIKSAASANLTTGLNSDKSWLDNEAANLWTLLNSTQLQPTLREANATFKQFVEPWPLAQNVSGFNLTMNLLLNKTRDSIKSSNTTLVQTLLPLPGAISGRDDLRLAAAFSADSIMNFSTGVDSTALSTKATDLKSSIDTAKQTLLGQASSTSGASTNTLFTAILDQLQDYYEEQSAIAAAANADVNSMKSLVAQLAASVGMSVSEFETEIVNAQSAIQQMHSASTSAVSGAAADAADSAAATSSSSLAKLQEQAVHTTMSAVKASQGIGAVSSGLKEASDKVAQESAKQAAASLSAVTGSTADLTKASSALLSSLANNATNQASSMQQVSTVMSAAARAAAALSSSISTVGVAGGTQLSMSGSSLSQAFGTILTNIDQYMHSEVQQLIDANNANALNEIGAVAGVVGSSNKTLDTLRFLADTVDRSLRSLEAKIGFANVSDTVSLVSLAMTKQESSIDALVLANSQQMNTSSLNAPVSLATLRGTEADKLTALQISAYAQVADIADKLTGASVKALSNPLGRILNVDSEKTYLPEKVNSINSTYLADIVKAPPLRESLNTATSLLTNDSMASIWVTGHAATAMANVIQSRNTSLSDRLGFINGNTTSQLAALPGMINTEFANITSKSGDKLQGLINALNSLADQTVNSAGVSKAQAVALLTSELVSDMNDSAVGLESWLGDWLKQEQVQTDLSVLVPFFALTRDVRTYARMATANLSTAALASQALTSVTAGALSSLAATAQSAQDQAATALGLSQADASNRVQQADLENEINAKVASASAAAVGGALANFDGVLKSVKGEAAYALSMANLNYSLLNASWSSQLSDANMAINTNVGAAGASIANTTQEAIKLMVEQLMSDIMHLWVQFKDGDVVTIGKIKDNANAGIMSLIAEIQARTGSNMESVPRILSRVESFIDSMNTLRVTGESLADYPTVANASLEAVRSELDTLQTVSVDALKGSVESVIHNKEATAAMNVLRVYQSLSSLLSKTSAKVARLAEFK